MMSSPTNNVPPSRKLKNYKTWEINLLMKDKKTLRPIIIIVVKRLNISNTRNDILTLKMLIFWLKTKHS